MLIALVASVLLSVAAASSNGSTYMILAPAYIRPGYAFVMDVRLTEATGGDLVEVKCQLVERDTNYVYRDEDRMAPKVLAEDTMSLSVSPDITHNLQMAVDESFQQPSWTREVVLVVNGSGAMTFSHVSQSLTVLTKRMSIFVQTDKALYKPGQTVKFRAFATYHTLLPFMGPLDFKITDPQNNVILSASSDDKDSEIKQNPDSGMVSGELMLSAPTLLGTWTITVKQGVTSHTKTFSVEEYVLPRFEVKIGLPSYFLYHEDLKGFMTANYVHGKAVKGDAVITITERPGYYCRKSWEMVPKWDKDRPVCRNYTLQAKLDEGKVDFRLSNAEMIKLASKRHCGYNSHTYCQMEQSTLRSITWSIEANVTDESTGKMISESSILYTEYQNVRLQAMPFSPKSYKPGMPLIVAFKMEQPDGQPPTQSMTQFLNGTKRLVRVVTTMNPPPRPYDYYPAPPPGIAPAPPGGMPGIIPPDGEKEEYQPEAPSACRPSHYPPKEEEIPSDGFIFVYYDKVIDGCESMSIKLDYTDPWGDDVYTYHTVNAFETRSKDTIQISIDMDYGSVMPNSNAMFTLASNTKIQRFTCELWSKGFKITSKLWTFPAPTFNFDIPTYIDGMMARSLAPSARVFCWYITPDGEMIADSVDFNVASDPANKVSLKYSVNETTPGESVSLTVKAFPKSHVALMAVDLSTLLLKENEGIDQETVDNELRQYDTYSNWYPMPFARGIMIDRRKRSMPICAYSRWCWPYYSSATSVKELLGSIGMIVMTNLYIHGKPHRDIYPMYRGAAGPDAPLAAAAPVDDSQVAEADLSPDNTGLKEAERTRKDFPETWLWMDGTVGNDGKLKVEDLKAPDTITSWVTTGFALSSTAGLGVLPKPSRLTVFKPFFIQLSLPYSVIRGEEFLLKVIVYNYMDQDLTALVTLESSDEFRSLYKGTSVSIDIRKSVQVPADGSAMVQFLIIPFKIGNIPITAQAQTTVAADKVMRILPVEPEGTREEYCDTSLVHRPSANMPYWMKSLQTKLPSSGVVPGSGLFWITAIGDPMGNSINSLESLVRLPTGCGEQNMVGFVPNIFVMKYFSLTNQGDPATTENLIKYMKIGYQRELTYKRVDYSYSAYGTRDASGSTWLTAFVIMSFTQASAFIPNTVDMYVVKRGAEWVLEQQNDDGSFNEPGKVHNSRLKGGASNGVPLTAYVVLALLEAKNHSEYLRFPEKDRMVYETKLDKAIKYLEEHLDGVKDDYYAISIIAYALVKTDSARKTQAMNYLKDAAITQNGMVYWAEEPESLVQENPWMWRYGSLTYNVEATAYAMLAYVTDRSTSTSDALAILRYLTSKFNSQGGYASTQDTILALQAISSFATDTASAEGTQNIDLSVRVNGNTHDLDPITKDNSFVLQKLNVDVVPDGGDLVITGKGAGVAIVQFCASYYLTKPIVSDHLEISVHWEGGHVVTENMIEVSVCFRWNNYQKESGMGMIEFNTLSGYEADISDTYDTYKEEVGLKRVEKKGKRIAFYLDEFKTVKKCMLITQYRIADVGKLQGASAKMLLYYSPETEKVVFYNPKPVGVNLCLLCKECCEKDDVTDKPASSAVCAEQSVLLTILMAYVISVRVQLL